MNTSRCASTRCSAIWQDRRQDPECDAEGIGAGRPYPPRDVPGDTAEGGIHADRARAFADARTRPALYVGDRKPAVRQRPKIVCPACAFFGARRDSDLYGKKGGLRWSYPTTRLWTAGEQIANPFRQGSVFGNAGNLIAQTDNLLLIIYHWHSLILVGLFCIARLAKHWQLSGVVSPPLLQGLICHLPFHQIQMLAANRAYSILPTISRYFIPFSKARKLRSLPANGSISRLSRNSYIPFAFCTSSSSCRRFTSALITDEL